MYLWLIFFWTVFVSSSKLSSHQYLISISASSCTSLFTKLKVIARKPQHFDNNLANWSACAPLLFSWSGGDFPSSLRPVSWIIFSPDISLHRFSFLSGISNFSLSSSYLLLVFQWAQTFFKLEWKVESKFKYISFNYPPSMEALPFQPPVSRIILLKAWILNDPCEHNSLNFSPVPSILSSHNSTETVLNKAS